MLARSSISTCLGLTLLPLSVACSFDTGKSQFCDREVLIDGKVAGKSVNYEDYEVQSVFFNTSFEEDALREADAIDREVMAELGLDPDDPEDLARYRYFTEAYDLRFLFIEQLDSTDYGSLGASIGRDLGIYYFDLAASGIQPDTAITVMDASGVAVARESGDTDALGAELRSVIDEMRENGHPDLIVAFDPDRSDEGQAQASLIDLFGESAEFADSGKGLFNGVLDSAGNELDALTYPVADLDSMSTQVDVTFGEQVVSIDATCVVVNVSG
jgi:hypothetical protein